MEVNMIPNKNGRIYPNELLRKSCEDFYIKMANKKRKEDRKTKLEKIEQVQFRNDRMV